MNIAAAWHSGLASDPGLHRSINEDRVFADDGRGIFLVVDGLGGHAAGEIAAETAVQTIANRMRSLELHNSPEVLIRQAIAEANNRIYELADSHPEWRGMACVLTLAVIQDDRITVGHVGDSRLYLFWNGQLKKLTSDHSPVGEQEDQGALTEEQAMKHPRRNEVFRDVGSCHRNADDPNFVDIKRFSFRPDAALLLSSDGLSDVLTSAEISTILERYDGTADKTAQQLIQAANDAGGIDNVSVVFVPGPDFLGSHSQALLDARPRHAITRSRGEQAAWRSAVRSSLWLLAGTILGMALWFSLAHWLPQRAPFAASHFHAPILVNSADSHGIQRALEAASAGDTIEIPAGNYLGPLELKNHVNVVARAAAQVKLRSDPSVSTNSGIAIAAHGVEDARVEGLQIVADDTHPLRIGVAVVNSSPELANVDVSGAIESGIRIEGSSQPVLLGNFLHANSGPGVMVAAGSAPRLIGNWITENGRVPHALRPGIEVAGNARPFLSNNVVIGNGAADNLTGDPFSERSK